jgi:hypothetical protein
VPAKPDWGDDRFASSPHGVHRWAAGRHRAPGLSGPAGRYGFIVITLVVTSSLPILAAIGVSSASVGGSLSSGVALSAPTGTTPFIAPPSTGPVVVVPLPAGETARPYGADATPSPARPPISVPARPVRPRLPREDLAEEAAPHKPAPARSAPPAPSLPVPKLPRQIVVIIPSPPPLPALPYVPRPLR